MVQGQHDSQVPIWSQVAALPRASIPPLTVAMDITEDSDCGRTMGPDVALSHSSGSDVTMAPGGSTCHPNLYDPDGHMALKHQHGLKCQPRLQTSAWPSVATGATDINTEPGCCRAMVPDIALGSSPALDITTDLVWKHRPGCKA